ncbi:hypothetical protein AWC17_30155 [Mycobacterium nebraskense]|uniref:Uncharacterized protein n=1 Tax=Mycobacterium nebraskense TaxID=244292 RepID=A0A1X1ZSW5_9MYCO|nr:hypothetical protein [Mycobacterium nebraskense]KLO45951.1 hypothetical protein ABW17_05755 [Mycobacterium nebraskense]MCV7116223.1 hypothetical protein [Mycobacterium nebraskense]ORW26447.1 hypothetical protein AWC17_30155 [Mycobacterium nebraskense]
MIKNGTRLRSQVCDTQVIVVKAADSLDDLHCGGRPMLPLDAERPADATLDPAFADGTTMGKRYVDDGDAEVLVTKAGAGSLSVGGKPLALKEAKPLPASD